MTTRRGLRLALVALLALPLGAAANEIDDAGPGAEPGLPEPAAAEQEHPAPIPAPPQPAPNAMPPSPPVAVTPPSPNAAPAAGVTGTQPPTADGAKVLGRPFPTPVAPPDPPNAPEVHVTIIPSQESGVTRNRLRGGAQGDAGTTDDGGEHQDAD